MNSFIISSMSILHVNDNSHCDPAVQIKSLKRFFAVAEDACANSADLTKRLNGIGLSAKV